MARKAKPKSEPMSRLPDESVLLSLDVSSSACGWSVFVNRRLSDFGLIKAPASWKSAERIDHHTKEIKKIAESCTHIVSERQSHKSAGGGFHAQGLAVLGHAQGELLGMLRYGVPSLHAENIALVSEREWTKFNGKNTPKKDRAELVKRIYPEYERRVSSGKLKDDGLDVADSLGIGLWRISLN